MKYEEAKKKLLEDIENGPISQPRIISLNFWKAQVEKKIALTNSQTMIRFTVLPKGGFEMGKIAENDKLKLELNCSRLKQKLKMPISDLTMPCSGLNHSCG